MIKLPPKNTRTLIVAIGLLTYSPPILFAETSPATEALKLADQAFQAKDYALCLKWNLKAAAENNSTAERHLGIYTPMAWGSSRITRKP